jgi:hypothetical protein
MKKEKTLLELAKSHQVRKTHKKVFNDEELELAIAWAHGEINLNQILEVLPDLKSQTQAYVFISNCFRNLVIAKRIKVE